MESSSTPHPNQNQPANKLRNVLIAIAAVVLAVVLLLSTQAQQSSTALNALAAAATPLDTALDNSKPTLVEFYADWCASCQSMAADGLALQKKFGDRVNFVMLNVDNNKWLPEITRFKVDGIPHFAFLGDNNALVGEAIGIVPPEIMAANLDAMVEHQPLPHIRTDRGQTSTFSTPRPADVSNPRDHS